MQNAALAELGFDWRYLAFDVHPDRLREAIYGARTMNFVGLNLTVPHKLLAMEMVDVLDESANKWGAVNTIRFEARDGSGDWRPLKDFTGEIPQPVRSHGFNTDADAIVQSLREDLDLKITGARVVLLGAGGAGRVAALKLAEERVGALSLVNRTRARAEQLAAEIRDRFPECKVETGYPAGDVDLVLNATSLGLKADDSLPLELSVFPLQRARKVYDMIYRPAETPLLAAARAAGCQVANGVGMLLHQGARALELWTGSRAPIEVMRAALMKNIYGV